jgi:hypothetical protein
MNCDSVIPNCVSILSHVSPLTTTYHFLQLLVVPATVGAGGATVVTVGAEDVELSLVEEDEVVDGTADVVVTGVTDVPS